MVIPSVNTNPEKLPTENEALRERFSNRRKLKTPAFVFKIDRIHFKIEANVSHFFGLVWTKKYLMHFQSQNSFLKFLRRTVYGALNSLLFS